MPPARLAALLENGAIAHLVVALRDIKANKPDAEPVPENYTDTEEAYDNGHKMASWEAGARAAPALKTALGEQ